MKKTGNRLTLEEAFFILYRNSLKNRDFGKEAPQNFLSGASAHCRRQGTSEDKNSEVKPMQPKTDSSGCFGIQQKDQNTPISIGEIFHILSGKGQSLILLCLSLPFCQPLQIPGLSPPLSLPLPLSV